MATSKSSEDGESLQERQENELQVLQAVFMDGVQDLRNNDAWKVRRPPEIKVSLLPQESMNGADAYVTLELIFKCPDDYPDRVPEIRIENVKGLSNLHVTGLQSELKDMAQSLVGEVMILDLCQHTQTFLHTHNRPPPKSFYEEMMHNKRKQEERQAVEQQKKMEFLKKKEEKQLQQIEEEIFKRQTALKEEARKRREIAKSMGIERMSLSEPNTPSPEGVNNMTPIPKDSEQRFRSRSNVPAAKTPASHNEVADSGSYHKPDQKDKRRRRTSTPLTGRSISSEEEEECKSHLGTTVLAFSTKKERTVHRGRCLGHSVRGSTVYAGMDTKSGELVAITEWIIKWRHASRKLDMDEKDIDQNEVTKYMKQVISIEQELFSLVKLSHRHLVHYQAIKYEQEAGRIIIYILCEYVGGGSLAHNLKHRKSIPLEALRQYCGEILDGISYLHNKAVTHKDLKASSLLLDSRGTIRLADYSLNKRLSDLVSEADTQRAGVRFDESTAPTIGARGGKKGDIYRLGIMLLSLAEGHPITDLLPEIPTHYPQDFYDFVTKCLIKDEQHRWSCHQLIDHPFVKTPIYTPLQPLTQATKSEKEDNESHDDDEDVETGGIPFIPSSDSGSRLQNEFEILKWLGKGGFGDVIKVRNKLDGRFYAIKRIPLNPNQKQFTKKITREVKLLSRLNHENVVRYYNSWIETSDEPIPSDQSSVTVTSEPSEMLKAAQSLSTCLSTPSAGKLRGSSNLLKNSIGMFDNIELLAPAPANKSVDWSMDLTGNNADNEIDDDDDDDSDDDDDDDEDGVFGASFLSHNHSDDGIVFEEESKLTGWSEVTDIMDKSKTSEGLEKAINDIDRIDCKAMLNLQFLYIQMEFCEKSTLRNLIDAGLYQDSDRVWQLFREIADGLSHIHDQGMIHRDLKPVNIFLDSNDHVKIGDFGLATTDIISRQQTSLIDLSMNPSVTMDLRNSSSKSDSSLGDGNLTGKVGTALYVSPEIMSSNKRAQYNQKVDIYSLGIIFFEMCYQPLSTGMERVKVIGNIRLPSVEFPEDFDEIEMQNQALVLRWLLNHDPTKRPTASELLQSDLLPPSHMEEAELNEVLRSTISNPESRAYKHMINTIFSQQVLPTTDFGYDSELYKNKAAAAFSEKQIIAQQHASDMLKKIFRKHGAIRLTTPLLMPRSTLYETSESYVSFMDHSGGIVSLPYDLRAPFARYVARNGITNLKRYTIDKVYRENRLTVYGLHPKEISACAFDIIASSPAHQVSDAEVIHVAFEIIEELPVLQSMNYYLRLNHTALLKGVLLHCGVPEELHQEVYAILGDTKSERQKKNQIKTKLWSLSLSDQTIGSLNNFLTLDGPFGQVASRLRCITKTKGPASAFAKKGINEMQDTLSHLDAMGCKLQPVLTIGFAYSVQHFSGIAFQIAAEPTKKKAGLNVLAAGGRYDKMIAQFRKTRSTSILQFGVGISIAFDKVVLAIMEQESFKLMPTYEVLVCSLGQKSMTKEKLGVAKDLWALGLSTEVLNDSSLSLEEMQDYCRGKGITYMVILKDIASGYVRVRCIDRDKLMEKKVLIGEVADFLSFKVQVAKSETSDSSQGVSAKTSSTASQSVYDTGSSSSGVGNHGGSSGHGGTTPSYNVTFITQDSGKLAKNTRRVYESTIFSTLSSALAHISKSSKVEVLGLEFTAPVIKTVAAYLDLEDDEAGFESSIGIIMEKHPRHKKYLTKIFDHIHDVKYDSKIEKVSPVLILYGLKDNSYKIIL